MSSRAPRTASACHRGWAACAVLALLLSWPCGAIADAPAPRIMGEPTEYTNVLDAFEGDALFDFAAHLSYRLRSESARIRREQPSISGRASSDFVHLADSQRDVKELIFGLDLGIYRDLMLSVRVPFVLSDERTLSWVRGRGEGDAQSGALQGVAGLFPTEEDFESKSRFGFPGLDLGLRWGVTNQFTSPRWPTWVLLADLQLATGAVQRPCQAGADCEAGITPGTSRLRFESRFSYRYRHAEPYLGVAYTHPYVAAPGEALYAASEVRPNAGSPPKQVGLTTGIAVIPWEDRRRFQRITLDLRGHARYVGAGRGASPLFDVLGTAPATAGRISGLTELQPHAQVGLDAAVLLRAAQYVRFRAAVEVAYNSPYLVTGAPYCDGALSVEPGGTSGTCGGAAFLPLIDLPGQRFQVEDELSLGIFATALGQF